MLTKRMMLGAGALALALSLSACSDDRAGGATGISEVPAAPRANAPGSVAITTPPMPDAVAPSGGGSSDGAATVISSSVYDGHQVVLSEVTTSGAKVTRVTLDGGVVLDVQGGLGELYEGAEANAFFYDGGQLIMQDQLLVSAAPSAAPRPVGGPQMAQALPCMEEMAAFGAASLALSFRLYVLRSSPTFSNWGLAGAAGVAVLYTARQLYLCLHAHG